MNNYKYIKEFNPPFLKYQAGNTVRIINTDEIVEVEYWGIDKACIYFKSGLNHEINFDAAKEIADFLTNRNVQRFIELDPETLEPLHESQSMYEWLNQEGHI